MKKSKMKATSLRSMMIAAIIILIGVSALGFYYIQGLLNTYAGEVGVIVAKSTPPVNTNTTGIQKLQEEITERQVSFDKANTLAIPTADYQTQMVKDINKYASETNITITDYSFAASTSAPKNSTLLGGLSMGSIIITISNPVQFNNLMQFLALIESNIPKMQLKGINLSATQSPAGAVVVESLTIEVYTK